MYMYIVHTFIGNYYCGVGLIVIWLHYGISKYVAYCYVHGQKMLLIAV